MKIIIGISLFLLLMPAPGLSQQATVEPSFALSIGIGSIYNGIGGNVAYVSEQDMKYVSYGCTEITTDNKLSECGFGIGWIRTDLFNADTNKHGIGIYLSQVDEEFTFNINNPKNFHKQNILALGLSYTYFHNGINNSGFNAGFSVDVNNGDGRKSRYGSFLQVGYQF
jgi:hypothetical protein